MTPPRGRGRPRCACGGPLAVRHRGSTLYYLSKCQRCLSRRPRDNVKILKNAREACVDWTSDPCSRCGRWPLSIHNKRGLCNLCGRKALGGSYYRRLKKEQKVA